MNYFNTLGQPVGKPIPNWKIAKLPTGENLVGVTCRLELLNSKHAPDLWAANSLDKDQKNFTYLPYGPFADFTEYEAWVTSVAEKPDPLFYAIIDASTNKAVGVTSFEGVYPKLGSVEIGHLNYSPLMQRTIISSETFILMARHAFSLGNRTLVWRCHSLNYPSANAAKRFGYRYECFFQNYSVMKGLNRNTAWFSIIEEEWPAVNEVHTKWLDLALNGKHQSLSVMIAKLEEQKGQYLPQHEKVWKDFSRHQNRLKDYPNVHEDIYTNELGLPVSKPCPEWKAPQELPLQSMIGKSCMLELLTPKHSADLWEAFSHDKEGRNWTYMPYGPFLDTKSFEEWLQSLAGKQDPITHAVIDLKTGKAVGLAAFINIIPDFGAIGIGHVNFSPLMQRSTISSEAIILMARKAFELGHRRLEWVCHKLNSVAVSAAKRYGFCYEGVFRNYLVAKGHNQDIAWFSITEEEWPELDDIFTKWLFLAHNNEYQSLSKMIEKIKRRKK